MTPHARIRTLGSQGEAALEAQRQRLLDQEWKRRRSKLGFMLIMVGVATEKIPLKEIVDILGAAVGVR